MPHVKDSDLPVVAFPTALEWQHWLSTNHASAIGIWLRFYKKYSGVATVSYDEALDEALCFGWIDGQLKKYDEQSWIQRFTPRRPKSIWSNRNKEHVQRLMAAGRMHHAGLQAVRAAKADGRWENSYDSPSKMTIPEDFLTQLVANTRAKAFFDTLNRANLYAIAWRLQTAKKNETRNKRIAAIIAMLEKGQAFHS